MLGCRVVSTAHAVQEVRDMDNQVSAATSIKRRLAVKMDEAGSLSMVNATWVHGFGAPLGMKRARLAWRRTTLFRTLPPIAGDGKDTLLAWCCEVCGHAATAAEHPKRLQEELLPSSLGF